MTRFVVAAVLAVALVAASMPAVESARIDRTAVHLDGELTNIVDAARDLPQTEDTVDDSSLAARRVVAVSVPERSLTSAPIDYVELDGRGPTTSASLSYRLTGHEETTYRFTRISLSTPDGPVRLSTAGIHRLSLALVDRGGRPVVTLRRLDLGREESG
ncbi:DUF7311 family protein [Haloprofundus marisrubri]|uniref:DUF7311 family protein n=1 Tax=Haloprofundus marisrubri TaxID=1514971 RepID=UPI0008F867D9|nr:hypothetical protein [Haloprofundus marisrubri]